MASGKSLAPRSLVREAVAAECKHRWSSVRREGRQQSDDEDEYDDNDTMNNDHYQHYYPLYCCYHPAVIFSQTVKATLSEILLSREDYGRIVLPVSI